MRTHAVSLALGGLVLGALALGPLLLGSEATWARNNRSFDPIVVPQGASSALDPALLEYTPVARATVESGVEEILAAWNGPQLVRYLADDFRGAAELVQNVRQEAPRDTRLRLTALRGVRTVEQTVGMDEGTGLPREVVDLVVATAAVQIELSNPQTNGFERTEGEIELLLRFHRPLVEARSHAGARGSP